MSHPLLLQSDVLAVLQEVVEAEQAAAQGVAQNAVVLFQTQLKFGRNLLIFSVAAGPRLDLADRLADHPAVAVHRTRRPVTLANLVEHRSADADAGEGFEAGALAGVVF